MPVLLNRQLYEELCELNKDYLRNQNLIIDGNEDDIDLSENHNLINQLIRNEEDNVKACSEKYQKEKNKTKYTILVLGVIVALIGAGFGLAPLFIVTTIALPILSVLLLGFAIKEITELSLNMKVNRHEAGLEQTISALNQLREIDKNFRRESVNQAIQEIKNETLEMHGKIDTLGEKNTYILTKLGMFSAVPTPIPNVNLANGLDNGGSASSPTFSS